MRQFEIKAVITEYSSAEELPEQDRDLLTQARLAARQAYAPYSNFMVGAAVRLANGRIVIGNNQENVAYPSGLCAERVAVFAAGANHPDTPIETIAVSCHSPNYKIDQPLSPCGACRQAMAEYETHYGKPIRVILGAAEGPVQVINSIADLLPLIFRQEELKK